VLDTEENKPMFTHQPAHTAKKTTTASPKQQRPHSMTLTRQTHPAAIIQRATAAPESLTAADVLQLQRTIGNRAVGQLLSGIGAAQREPADHGSLIRAKLTINPPDDVYEQEADRVAEQVVDRINQPASQPAGQGQAVQRQEIEEEEELLQGKMIQRQPEEEEEEELQMMPIVQREPGGGIAATPDLESAIQRARGSGQPLSRGIRAPMEQAFGADFSGVRIHTDTESDLLNRSIQARAFTTGQDIFFRQGAYDPGSRGGQELLAHEMTHVVQQNAGEHHLQPIRWPWNRKNSEYERLLNPEEEEEREWGKALRNIVIKYAKVIAKAFKSAWGEAKRGSKLLKALNWIKKGLGVIQKLDPTNISRILKKVITAMGWIIQGVKAWAEIKTGEHFPLIATAALVEDIDNMNERYPERPLPPLRLPDSILDSSDY